MDGAMLDFLEDLLKTYLVEVLLVITLGIWWTFRGRLKHKDATIRRLQGDIDRRENELGQMQRRLESVGKHCEDLEARSPQRTLEIVERELLDNNHDPAHRAIVGLLRG
jgi:hypothetical protein